MIVMGDLMTRYYANACDRILLEPQTSNQKSTNSIELPVEVIAAIRLHDTKEAAHSKPCKGRAISKALKHGQLTKEQCHYLLNCIPDEEIREYAEQYL